MSFGQQETVKQLPNIAIDAKDRVCVPNLTTQYITNETKTLARYYSVILLTVHNGTARPTPKTQLHKALRGTGMGKEIAVIRYADVV